MTALKCLPARYIFCIFVVYSYTSTYTCRIHIDAIIKTSEDFFKKIYLSLYLKGLCVRGSWRPNRTAIYWPPTLMAISIVSFSFSRFAQPGAWGPTLLGAGFFYHILSPTGLVFKLTDFLSSPSYLIVQLPTQYLPITGHWDVSLPLSLKWHVWLSSSGDNCHAVHRSLSSDASVYDCTVGFYLVPYCQPSLPTPMEYATSVSLEWYVWPDRRSIYYIISTAVFEWKIKMAAEILTGFGLRRAKFFDGNENFLDTLGFNNYTKLYYRQQIIVTSKMMGEKH